MNRFVDDAVMRGVRDTVNTVDASQGKRAMRVSRAFTLLIMLVFVILLMGVLIAGVNVFRTLNDSGAAVNNERQSLSLVVNAIRANDASDAVRIAAGPEGDMLVLSDRLPSGVYETRLYLYQGSVMEEYSLAQNAASPERAVSVARSKSLTFELAGSGVRIGTDDGSAFVTLRSAGAIHD